MKRETEDTHIYFPKKVLKELRKWAALNRRSVTAETVVAVEEYVQRLRETAINGTTSGKGRR